MKELDKIYDIWDAELFTGKTKVLWCSIMEGLYANIRYNEDELDRIAALVVDFGKQGEAKAFKAGFSRGVSLMIEVLKETRKG